MKTLIKNYEMENLKEEVWKDIEGYENLYQVSNLGNVKSLNYNKTGTEKILKPAKHSKGYFQVQLWKDGKMKTFFVHRLVAQAFIENPLNLPQVNHRDENPQNNHKSNLEFCDARYNNSYGTRIKRISKKVSQYSLNGELIREFPSASEVERQLGFSKGNISSCCNGRYKSAYGYVWSYIE